MLVFVHIAVLLLSMTAGPNGIGAVPSEQPNILLVLPDELRYDWGGTLFNVPLKTPNIDSLRRRGTSFRRAVVAAPVCAPSRACLASGREYDMAGVPMNFHNDFNLSVPTFYQSLSAAGYWTMVTGRDDLDKSRGGPGINGSVHTKALGFDDAIRCDGSTDVTFGGVPHEPFGVWLASQRSPSGNETLFEMLVRRFAVLGKRRYGSYAVRDATPLPDNAYQDNWIGSAAIELLTRRPKDKPFFLEVSHQAPHPPLDITQGMKNTVVNRTDFPLANFTQVPEDDQMVLRQNYAAKIERVDYWLGQYLELLKQQGIVDNTVVCFTSDHGEMLGDRNTFAKSKPWHSAMGVPLVCAGPGIQGDYRVVEYPTTTMDLAATFIDFAGSKKPENMTSTSLRPLLSQNQSTAPIRQVVHSGLNTWRAVMEYINATTIWKFFCCNGACPGSIAEDRKGMVTDEYHLYNMADNSAEGMAEAPSADLKAKHPDLVKHYASMLPPPHQTPPNPKALHADQGYGYRWLGCQL